MSHLGLQDAEAISHHLSARTKLMGVTNLVTSRSCGYPRELILPGRPGSSVLTSEAPDSRVCVLEAIG